MIPDQPATPPEVVAVLARLLRARGIDLSRQREIARMAHGIDRGAALWLGSADEAAYRRALQEAKEQANVNDPR